MPQPESQLNTPCTKVSILQGLSNGVLAGPYERELKLNNGITACISQCICRRIEITSTVPIPCLEIFNIFQDIETLLMLFDGRFYPIEELIFDNGSEDNTVKFSQISEELLGKRLHYFESRDFCQFRFLKLLQFQDVLTDELLEKWIALRTQLDIAFSLFLYTLSDNKMPVETNFAFLAELAEPFVELLKENRELRQKLSLGEKVITLKNCISAIIDGFGKDIFSREISDNYEGFKSKAIHSRNRVMHIKKKQTDYFSKKDCIRYSIKFSLLYRRILLDLLDIPYEDYKANIECAVKKIDEYFDSLPQTKE